MSRIQRFCNSHRREGGTSVKQSLKKLRLWLKRAQREISGIVPCEGWQNLHWWYLLRVSLTGLLISLQFVLYGNKCCFQSAPVQIFKIFSEPKLGKEEWKSCSRSFFDGSSLLHVLTNDGILLGRKAIHLGVKKASAAACSTHLKAQQALQPGKEQHWK